MSRDSIEIKKYEGVFNEDLEDGDTLSIALLTFDQKKFHSVHIW
jgi:hypothetical protein